MATKLFSQKFKLERETKGTYVFKEIDAKGNVLEVRDSKIGTIYIRKTEVKGTAPQGITITVEAD